MSETNWSTSSTSSVWCGGVLGKHVRVWAGGPEAKPSTCMCGAVRYVEHKCDCGNVHDREVPNESQAQLESERR